MFPRPPCFPVANIYKRRLRVWLVVYALNLVHTKNASASSNALEPKSNADVLAARAEVAP